MASPPAGGRYVNFWWQSVQSFLACIGATTLSTIMLAVHETPATPYPKPRLLDRVRDAIRARHYSRETEKAYLHWIKRYIFFHGKRHPLTWGRRRSRAS